MNILKKLTLTNLKLNKKRTIVTIIGIILSVALITALSTLISSFRESLHEFYIKQRGNYHYAFYDISDDDLKIIKKNNKVESYYLTKGIGYAKIDSKNESKPYVYVLGVNNDDFNSLSINLIKGRLPKNSNEVLIPKHLSSNGSVYYNIGDEISLDIGDRYSDGYLLNMNNPYNEEEILDTKIHKKYKIVGIIERPIYAIEPYVSPGYTIITNITNDCKHNNIYLRYSKEGIKYRYRVTANILGINEKVFEDTNGGKKFNYNSDESFDKIKLELDKAKYQYNENSNLIYLETMPMEDQTISMLYTTFIVVALIIIVTSIFCIKNSFNISITEKIGLYGMLRSVGATKKQIKKNVLYEGFILSLMGIPLGILSGLLASFILIKISNVLLDNTLTLNLVYSISIYAILVSIILSIITIYLSAIKSAKMASNVPPINALRNSSDIKITKKNLKSPKLISKLFGIGGLISYKNIKRNKKKYKTIVISIIVSVSVFIATTTFMNYGFKMTKTEFKDLDYNIKVIVNNIDSNKKSKIESDILKLDNINNYSLRRDVYKNIDGLKMTDDYKDFLEKSDLSSLVHISSYGDKTYKEYLNKLNLTYKESFDKVILINKTIISDESNIKKEIINANNTIKDNISIIKDNENKINISIIKITDTKPEFSEEEMGSINFIVSDYLMDKLSDSNKFIMYIDSNNADKLENNLKNLLDKEDYNITNLDKEKKQVNGLVILVSIFLYGFIIVIALIGITSVFNTITTSMELRSKEFAMLKSVGMTKSEFNKMIRLESIMSGTKALIIGIPIGIILSYLIYLSINSGNSILIYYLPIKGIIISVCAVFILIILIMQYSLNKINKQNIIETIRKDNI